MSRTKIDINIKSYFSPHNNLQMNNILNKTNLHNKKKTNNQYHSQQKMKL